MGLLTKNREYGYYWTLKGSKWAINEYYQNKWTGGVPDEYWDDIEEIQIVRKEEFEETTSSCTIDSVKPSFLLPAIASGVSGCLNCGYTEEILPLETELYFHFGGWTISRDGEQFSCKQEEENLITMDEVERLAKSQPECDWRAILDLPLRSAVYQRHNENKWVLVERGKGFA